mmetsp:Transcript_4495/g.6782  ORF Transcript_4495/g.6782 Transcript_4495/m.6782 type:complete len:312 (+) Transcript_4495:164-1099(+)|eukprot:CAMPEP_0116996900 /NCGR_PEP_ID=MMETSP0472-20121206/538_1 /TAXON_ID=693140 ORGANISM="Tiarina fusus, Strain LIS" /NCGR_SAMPLE_ID=MMETSP0472 /ASSEMBLY_ACC=CAM_ASM_000603 /LENGTH=311 /DNA_ID=CAMNT_0004695647 /DNA_START=162 /DNA_END=1097 /DNA_ORIENTATION=-
MPDNQALCALFARGLILVLACVGVGLSIASATNCKFLLFENSAGLPWPTLQDPFDGAIEAHLGMFSYRIIRAADESRISEECEPYGERFTELDTPVLAAAQICALCAPIFTGAAILFLLMEMCVCNFFGSFLVSSALLVVASGAQAATFSVYAEQDFCYASDADSEQKCEVGTAGILSGIAAILFWVSGLLVCCVPRPNPICLGGGSGAKRSNSEQEVVVPIVIEDDDFNEQSPPAPTRKNSNISLTRKNSNTPLDSKIRHQDFATPSVADGTRVEVKEKEFPDGTRQVDEITHYADGSKSVKTQTFKPDE